MKLPLSKNKNIVVQETDKELLIYDLLTNQAFCLNETSAIVYLACDGKNTFEELKHQTGFSDSLILLTLDELQKQNLCQGERIDYLQGISRRELIHKVGLASMVALPLISSIVVPRAVDAQSSNGKGACLDCLSSATDLDAGLGFCLNYCAGSCGYAFFTGSVRNNCYCFSPGNSPTFPFNCPGLPSGVIPTPLP